MAEQFIGFCSACRIYEHLYIALVLFVLFVLLLIMYGVAHL